MRMTLARAWIITPCQFYWNENWFLCVCFFSHLLLPFWPKRKRRKKTYIHYVDMETPLVVRWRCAERCGNDSVGFQLFVINFREIILLSQIGFCLSALKQKGLEIYRCGSFFLFWCKRVYFKWTGEVDEIVVDFTRVCLLTKNLLNGVKNW